MYSRRTAVAAAAAVAAALVGAGALGAGSASAAPATGTVRAAAPGRAIAGHYLVAFKDAAQSASAATARTARLASAHRATVRQTYTTIVKGFAATMSDRDARQLAADPAVAYVEQDAK